jgi:hypothetical protein
MISSESGLAEMKPRTHCAGSGSQLRTDDPASLKDIVGLVQDKTKGKEKTMTCCSAPFPVLPLPFFTLTRVSIMNLARVLPYKQFS